MNDTITTQRIIKFRGKSKFDGRWVYGLPRIREGMDHAIIEEPSGLGHDVDRETVTEWTGLKDKNGQEIYEGDIVQFDNFGYGRGVVTFENGTFGWRHLSQGFHSQGYDYMLGTAVVIGNVHETPDLMVG